MLAGRAPFSSNHTSWAISQRKCISSDGARLLVGPTSSLVAAQVAEVERIVLATRMDALDGLSLPQQEELSRSLLAVKASLSRALSIDQPDPAPEEAED